MSIRWPVVLAVLGPLLLGTAGVLGAALGVMPACPAPCSCRVPGCAPCRSTSWWLNAGWAARGVLLIAGGALAATARRGLGPPVVRTAAFAIVCLSVLAIVVPTAL